ncbi:hypothetical protein ACM55H_16170 [Flavobacterium sp. ZT3R17]|uniref:hypothetical protein n=1 Tax=Flavobacterium cryoconiti TaxID=3398736 RepID=UPI003A89B446
MECPIWQPYLATHLFKFSLLNSSLIKEFEGISFNRPDNNGEHKTYNVSALYLLSRATIETFLLLNYLYFNYKDESQGIFRYFLYEWSGLKTRQNYIATHPDSIAKKASEKTTIDDLENGIKLNTYFLSLPDYKRKNIINSGRAKEISWKEIVSESGLEQNSHFSNWEFYSNYAHCEQIEAMQLKELFQSPQKINDNVYHTLNCTIIYEAILILNLKNKYKQFEEIYDAQSLPLKTKIDFWAKIGIEFKIPS